VCSGDSCDASNAITNGALNDCTSTLASGATCTPTCNTGYTLSGTRSCTAGALADGDKGVVVLHQFFDFYLFSEGPHRARLP
jgi:hypothetical protein